MKIRSRGRDYWYLRRRGQKLIPLPSPEDPGFDRALEVARAGTRERPLRLQLGSIAALAEAAMASDRYLSRSTIYRATLRRHFDAIRAAVGDAPAKGLRDYMVRSDVAKAASPVDRLKAWRFLSAFGCDAGLLAVDPTLGVKAARRKVVGHEPWSADDKDAFRARWRIGTTKRLAFELLSWTGARIGDAVMIGPGMVGRDGVLAFRQRKTGGQAYVPWTCTLPPYAAHLEPERAYLRAAIEAAAARHMTFLATSRGETRSDKALGTMIREAAASAEVEKTAHGLRKSRAVELADGGATPHQIGAWTGHETLKEVAHYSAAADRRRAVMGTEREENSAKHSAPCAKREAK